MKQYIRLLIATAFGAALVALPFVDSRADGKEYSFKVHNTTKETITKLMASEDGESYGAFDIGKEGIAPGQAMTLTWDKTTNSSSCHWYFKAVYEGGEESKPVQFDFCKENLELEF